MSGSAKVHGLDGTLVKSDWPGLTLAEIRVVFAQLLQAGDPLEITFVSPRPLSAAAVVQTAQGKFFVKRHACAVRDTAGLHEEHEFLSHLRTRGAPVPRVLHDAAGRSAIEIDRWTYEVHEAAPGLDIYADAISWTPFFRAEHAREAGRALAQLHLAAADYAAPRRRPQPLVSSFIIFADADPSTAMARYLSQRPALAHHRGVRRAAEQALAILAPYHAELPPLLPHLPPLWTHNDLHCSNLLWSGAGDGAKVTSVIDFGLSDRTNAMHDLATAIERNIVEWLALMQDPAKPENVSIHLDHLEALLAGYESIRPLTREEATALAPMTALCHTEFALSEADYFLGVLHSEESARMAYDDYLLGHARWFGTSRGQALLNAIQQWAAACASTPTAEPRP